MTIEALLARVYADAAFRAAFLADPAGTARRAGVDEAVVGALRSLDVVGVELFAASLAAKRDRRGRPADLHTP